MGAKVAGTRSPDGAEEIHCDLPGELHRKNTSSRGRGLCVFTSIHHSAVSANVPALQEFPRWLITKGIPGGYPQKVADLIPKMCRERGLPEPEWIQVEGKDLEVLKVACKTGRLPAVTYSFSPTGRLVLDVAGDGRQVGLAAGGVDVAVQLGALADQAEAGA